MTLIICTAILGIGSEFLQGFLPNGRTFDGYDIVANIVGSLGAVGLCSWYHKRMLERKRQKKSYTAVPGEDEEDLELGEHAGVDAVEEGVTASGSGSGSAGAGERTATLEEQVDNWDENATDDWDDDGTGDVGEAMASPAVGKQVEANGDHTEPKKRTE